LPEREVTLRTAAPLAAGGLVVVWFSHAAALALAGVATVLLAKSLHRRDWSRCRALAGVMVVWTLSLGVFLAIAAGGIRDTRAGFVRGLPESFAPLPPSSAADLGWPWRRAADFAAFLGEPGWWGVAPAALSIVGLASLAMARRIGVALLLSPIAVVYVASGLELYPVLPRLTLFLAPIAIILVAEGNRLVRRTAGATAAFLVLAVVVVHPLWSTLRMLSDPEREAVRPLVERLQRAARAGDVLYVYYGAQYAFRYYAQCADCGTRSIQSHFGPIRPVADSAFFASALESSPPRLIVGSPRAAGLDGLRVDARRLAGHTRVWTLFSHYETPDDVDERRVVVDELDSFGSRRAAYELRGAALYLYDLSGPSG
jgi:hypothetical protein